MTGAREFAFVTDALGTDRLVYGTNFGGWDRGTGPDVTDLTTVLNANATRLLRLDVRAPHLLS